MSANKRMFVLYWLSPHDSTPALAKVGLLNRRVQSLEAMKSFFDRRRQTVVRFNLVDKGRVAANLRSVKNVQKRGTWGLLLVRNVRVPSNAAVTVGNDCIKLAIVQGSVN